MERSSEHYQELYSRETTVTDRAIENTPSLPVMEDLDTPPTVEELSKAVDSLANNKAPGKDGIPAEIIKAGKQSYHRIRSIQNAQQAIRHSSVIFVAPYWNYRISCLKVQLAPLAQDADSEKWNISLDYVKKRLEP